MKEAPFATILKDGIRAVRQVRLTLLLAFCFICAMTLPFGSFFHLAASNLGSTNAPSVILKSDPRISAMMLRDFLRVADVDGPTSIALFGAAVLFILANLFLSGGMANAVDGRVSPGGFWAACRRSFLKAGGVFACFALTMTALMMVIGSAVAIVTTLVPDGPPNSVASRIGPPLLLAFAACSAAIFTLAYDLARGIVARVSGAPVTAAWRAAVRMAFRRPLVAIALWTIWLAAALLFSLTLGALEWRITDDGLGGVALLAILLLALAISRAAVRVAAWGASISFLESSLAAVPLVLAAAKSAEAPYFPLTWEDDEEGEEC